MSSSSDAVEADFGPVADAFRRSISDSTVSGASLSIWIDGDPVVEIADGTADVRNGRPFDLDTIAPVFSCSKGMATILVGKLIQDGRLPGLDAPITNVWPEFGARGKASATLGDVLAHRGGVSAPRWDLTREVVLDELAVADLLASQEPLWEVPKHHQYHAFTFGPIVGKLVNLATGDRLGRVFEREIARPLGAETWFGLPKDEFSRVAHLIIDDRDGQTDPHADPEKLYWLERGGTMAGALPPSDVYNNPQLWDIEMSGMGALSTASGLARIWSATVVETNGLRLLNKESIDALRAPRSLGQPYFGAGPGVYQSWGAGLMIPSEWDPYLSEFSFGHDGAGGHVSFADSKAKLGFAYVTNQMADWARGISVVDSLARVLDAL